MVSESERRLVEWINDEKRITGELRESINALRSGQEKSLKIISSMKKSGHVCIQATKIDELSDAADSMVKLQAEDSEGLAVVSEKVSGLEKSFSRAGSISMTLGLFVAGLIVSSVISFFSLKSDVRMLSTQFEAYISSFQGSRVDSKVSPAIDSDIRSLCSRATDVEKRMLLDVFGSKATGCE